MRALIATANGFEESELPVPCYRLLEEGLEVDIAALRRDAVAGVLKGRKVTARDAVAAELGKAGAL